MWNHFNSYFSVEQRRERAKKKIKSLLKKNKNLKPVFIEGKKLANTWWGKAWNKNLASYADYESRIGRGRGYLRHHAVLDLQIHQGIIQSLVLGNESSPYKVEITIQKLKKSSWNQIKKICRGKLSSLQELQEGKFPKELEESFLNQTCGLFPDPSEIHFTCNCFDWAQMCKHISATLYGIAVRLDETPSLLFTLREVNLQELIGKSIESEKKSFLKKAQKKTKRVIQNCDLSLLFGMDIEAIHVFEKKLRKQRKRKKN